MTFNSAPYASYEERREWIAEATRRISRKVRIPHPLLAEIDLLKDEVAELQSLATQFAAHSCSISPSTPAPEVLRTLEASQFKPDRNAHRYLIPLERQVCQLLHLLKFDRSSTGLEYPINVRVVHGRPVGGYDKRDYATTTIHSDVWAGEPADTLQILIPLMGNVQSNICQWYETDSTQFDQYICNRSDYQSAVAELGEVKKIQHTFQVGTLYMFDSALPHQTIQGGGGVRVSLDFRLRRIFPYADPQWTSRMRRDSGAYSRYYLMPPQPYPYSSFEQKLNHEVGILEELGYKDFADIRRSEFPQ